MKKLLTGLLAVGLVLALALPAMAFDSEFGGYWRTRAYMQKDFTGSDTGAKNLQQVDTRTRLFYTAVFSEDFKFVNAFEFNVTWGDTSAGGGIGTDGTTIFRVKHSYANFTLGQVNFLIGLQPRILHRGFVFDDDYAGAVATFKGEGFSIPLIWMKAYEGGIGKDKNDCDVDIYALKPTFTFGNTALTPTLIYMYSQDAHNWASTNQMKEVKVYYAGLDADMKFGAGSSAWFTGIYSAGTVGTINAGDKDVKSYLLALGGTAQLGALDIHGQAFFATGDDNPADKDAKAFYVPQGQMYYWAEIMGMGLFDSQASANACAGKISNTKAINIGVGFKASDALKITADVWHAKLAENNSAGKDTLGTEVDLRITYALMKNLNLDVVAAYLFAGDATYSGAGEKNPVEIGTQLSFRF
jgi:hypothetical protein